MFAPWLWYGAGKSYLWKSYQESFTYFIFRFQPKQIKFNLIIEYITDYSGIKGLYTYLFFQLLPT